MCYMQKLIEIFAIEFSVDKDDFLGFSFINVSLEIDTLCAIVSFMFTEDFNAESCTSELMVFILSCGAVFLHETRQNNTISL